MNVLICGINGRMGKSIYDILKKDDRLNIIGFDNKKTEICEVNLDKAIDISDVIIDFTRYDISKEIINKSLDKGKIIISGTTGYTKSEIDAFYIKAIEHDAIIYWSPNYSKGYSIMLEEAYRLKDSFDSLDIVEMHSNKKIDKPSGTALAIANKIGFSKDNINSVRLNNTLATHSIILSNDSEKIIITHEITSKDAFIKGFMEVFRKIVGENYVRRTL